MILALALVCLQTASSLEARLARLDAWRASLRHEIWVTEHSSWERIISMNEARFAEGVLPERDLIQARLEGGLLEVEISESKLELEEARLRLAAVLGCPVADLPALEDAPEPDFPALPPLENASAAASQAASRYESAREQVVTFRLRLLASCEESASVEELLYQQLKTSLWTLLEARRSCRGIRLRYADTLHRAESAREKLRVLLGKEDFLS